MTVKTWNLIKHSKNFYVKAYRRAETVIVLSIMLNVLLGLGLIYVYLEQPERDYYATFGETPPVPLVALDKPNESSMPLLADENQQDSDVKNVPN